MPETIGSAYIQIKPTTEGIQSAIEKEMSSAGSAGGKSFSSAFGKIFGTTGAVIGGITAAVGGVSTALVNATSSAAEYGDTIDKMSQKMGISAEAYQEWDAVMQHSGTSMETLKASMKTMANAAQSNNEAFKELGITEEQLKTMSQEDLFSSVIAGLQNMEEGTERTYIASQLLGRGATELGALLNTSAEDTQAMKDRVHELGGVMEDDAIKAAAAFQDQLQDMQTASQSLVRNMASEFLPGITKVMSGLTDIFSGDTEKGADELARGITQTLSKLVTMLPQIMDVGSTIILALVDSISENLESILKTGMTVLEKLIMGIVEKLPDLIDTAADLIITVVDTLAEKLPEMLPKIIKAILDVVQKIIDNLPEILTSLLNLITQIVDSLLTEGLPIIIAALPDIIMGIIDFILKAIPQLINAVITIVMALAEALPQIIQQIVDVLPELIDSIISAILNNLPLFIKAGIDLFVSLITALPEIIVAIVKAIPEIIISIVDALIKAWPDIKEAGKDLLIQLMNGLTTIGTKIKDAVTKIWNALKESFDKLSQKAIEWGSDLLQNFIDGIKSKISALGDAVKGVAEKVKDFLGFSEPDEGPLSNFHTFAPDMIDLFAKGIQDNLGTIDKAMEAMSGEIATEMQVSTQAPIENIVPDDQNGDAIYKLLATYLPELAKGTNSKVTIEADSKGIFKVVLKESDEYRKQTGRSAFA